MTVTPPKRICVECLAEVRVDNDCDECGSGYWLYETASLGDLRLARKWAANESPFDQMDESNDDCIDW